MLKFRRSSLRLVFLINIVYNQFLLLKNYRLWHWIRSFVWLLPLISNPLYLISPQATKSQLEWSQLKFYKVWNKKGSVKKRKTSNNRSRVFKIALEGGSRVCQLAYAAYVHMPTFTGVRMILDMVIWTRTLIFFPYDFLKIYFSGRYNFMLFKIYCYIFDL